MNIVNAATMMKVILVTGATDGIGKEAARLLTAQGHRVLLHGRNPAKLHKVARELGIITADDDDDDDKNNNSTFVADLSDLSQVYRMAQQVRQNHDHIDVLINNAGVFKLAAAGSNSNHPLTVDGLDARIAVNAVAPYILTQELLPIIPRQQQHGRVVNVASAAQAPVHLPTAFTPTRKKEGSGSPPPPYSDDFEAYAQSKLAIMMWSNVLAERNPDRVLFSVNPASLIDTKMVRQGFGPASVRNDVRVGADLLVEAAVGKKFAQASGKYYDNDVGNFGRPHPNCLDRSKNEQLVQAMDALLASLNFCAAG